MGEIEDLELGAGIQALSTPGTKNVFTIAVLDPPDDRSVDLVLDLRQHGRSAPTMAPVSSLGILGVVVK